MNLVNPSKDSKCLRLQCIVHLTIVVFILQIDNVSALGRECSNGRDKRIDIPLCRLVDFSTQDLASGGVQNPQEFAHFSAISAKWTYNLYPTRVPTIRSLKRFDELPYPLPIGASLYFCTLTLVLLAWYVKTLVWAALHKAADRIDLFPETNKFPHVHLYSLQQSKREARLRREARNTWAWMANKYLLLPNDSKVNADVFKTTWSDFEIPRDVWGIVRAVMKVNAWFNRAKARSDKYGSDRRPQKLLNAEPFDQKKEGLKDRLEELKKDVDPTYEPALKNLVPDAAVVKLEPSKINVSVPETTTEDLPPRTINFKDPQKPLRILDSKVFDTEESSLRSSATNELTPMEPYPPILPEHIKDPPRHIQGPRLITRHKSMFEIIKPVPHGTAASSHVEMPDSESQNIEMVSEEVETETRKKKSKKSKKHRLHKKRSKRK